MSSKEGDSAIPTVAELDNVLFRLAMVKEEAMGKVVCKLLPRLLAQLTPHAFANVPVRNKLVQILTHLQKRLSAEASLQLPVGKIVELLTGLPCSNTLNFEAGSSTTTTSADESSLSNDDDEEGEGEAGDDPSHNPKSPNVASSNIPPRNPIRSNFAMVYLELGFSRLPADQKIDLLPSLVQSLHIVSSNANHLSSFLRLTMGAISALDLASSVTLRRKQLSFILDATHFCRDTLVNFWLDVLLFRGTPTLKGASPTPNGTIKKGFAAYYMPTSECVQVLSDHHEDGPVYYTIRMAGGREKQTTADRLSGMYIPPGLNRTAVHRICGTHPATKQPLSGPSSVELSKWKLAILRILRTECFRSSVATTLTHVLAGAVDSNHDVREMAQEYAKRAFGSVGRSDLEDLPVVQALLSLFIGGNHLSEKRLTEDSRSPASWALRAKILDQLLNSRLVVSMNAWCVKLTFESFFGAGTTIRVKTSGCQFARRFIEMAEESVLSPVKPLMLQALMKLFRQCIENELVQADAPSTALTGKGDLKQVLLLTSVTSSALVALASRAPELFGSNLELPNALFQLLVSSQNELRASAQEALSSLVEAYVTSSPTSILEQLRNSLLKHAIDDNYRVRLCALRWLRKLYPYSDPSVLFACIQMASDPRQEVRRLAVQGLQLPKFTQSSKYYKDTTSANVLLRSRSGGDSQNYALPKAGDMIAFLASPDSTENKTNSATYTFSSQSRAMTLDAVSLMRAIQLMQGILEYEYDALKNTSDSQASSSGLATNEAIIGCADLVSLAIESDVAQQGATQLLRTAASSLARIIELFPDLIGQRFSSVENLTRMEAWLSEPNRSLRDGAARVLMLVARWVKKHTLSELLERMLAKTLDRVLFLRSQHDSEETKSTLIGRSSLNSVSKLNRLHGAITGSAHLLAGIGKLNVSAKLTRDQHVRVVNMLLAHAKSQTSKGDTVTGVPEKNQNNDSVLVLKDTAIRTTCCECLGIVSAKGMLQDDTQAEEVVSVLISMARIKDKSTPVKPLGSASSSDSRNNGVEDNDDSENASVSVTGNHSYSIEKAVIAIGQVCIEYASPRRRACEELLRLITGHTTTLEDTHFAVGETLAKIGIAAAMSEESTIAPPTSKRQKMEKTESTTVEDMNSITANDYDEEQPLFEYLLTKLFKFLDDARPKVRGAAAVCFLCFVKYAPKNASVQNHLFDLQAAAMRLLGERSEFVQEVAGKIMSLVYDLADSTQRKTLLDSLSSTLSTGKRSTVDESTIDAIGSNGPAGAQLSQAGSDTYQQMCRAANDMGNPELIYKFLSFASHHSAWHSRRGAAFSIAELVGENALAQLRPNFPKILPRLYRTRFDPDPKTSTAMNRLWKALCGGEGANATDEIKIIREHFAAILHGTLPALTARHWRERLSATLALDDLLSIGRKASDVMDVLARLWKESLLMCDDIKEPVQKGGLRLVRTLGKLTVRLSDPSMTSNSDAAKTISVVLPYFLKHGVVDSCSTTRALSMLFLLKVVKVAKHLLVPHAAEVVPVLLEYLSSLESSDLVYLQQHADKLKDMTAEDLELIRLRIANAGPLAEAMTLCLERCYKSEESMASLVPALVALVQRGIGLATRAMSARVLVRLATHSPKLLKPHADRFLRPLSAGLSDRSLTVRKEFGKAIGQISRLCRRKAVGKLVDRLLSDYTESDPGDAGEVSRHAAGVTMHALATTASSKIKKKMSYIIPVAFIAKFSNEDSVKDIWSQVWDEITVNTSQGVRIHLVDTVDKVISVLEAGSYDLRRQGADALSCVLEVITADDIGGEGTDSIIEKIEAGLQGALKGRYWAGKEAVLKATVSLAKLSPAKFIDKMPSLVDRLMRECRRGQASAAYARESVTCLGALLEAVPEYDGFHQVHDMLQNFIGVSAISAGYTSEPLSQSAEASSSAKKNQEEEGNLHGRVTNANKTAEKSDAAMRSRAIECLGCAWPVNVQKTQSETIGSLVDLFSSSISASVWRVRVAIARAAGKVLCKIMPSVGSLNEGKAIIELVKVLRTGAEDIKFHQVRESSVAGVLALCKRAAKDEAVAHVFKPAVASLRALLRLLRDDLDPGTAQKAAMSQLELEKWVS